MAIVQKLAYVNFYKTPLMLSENEQLGMQATHTALRMEATRYRKTAMCYSASFSVRNPTLGLGLRYRRTGVIGLRSSIRASA